MLTIILKILIPFLVIMQILPFLIWLERKGAAYIQDRRGPNRASILGLRLGGLIHSLADVVKLVFKEDIVPSQVNKFVYTLAPFLAMAVACMTFAVIPWAAPLDWKGGLFTLQAVDLNVGILYLFAIASMGVYGIMLAGWGSNNKYSLLGGLRSSAQMISYELTLGLSVVGVLILAGSLELNAIVQNQGANPLSWNAIRQPLGCILFVVSAFAETNRLPFDLPEAEAELVAGYHVEYSSLKFALFFMAEYANMIVASALMATLFFGGWQVPFVSTEALRAHATPILYYSVLGIGVFSILAGWFLARRKPKVVYHDARDRETKVLGIPAILVGMALVVGQVLLGPLALGETGSQVAAAAFQFGAFLLKILFFCWVFIWVRWTLPRFRYDQLMNLGWRVMLPLALLNVVVTAGIYLWW
ncbi:NADH-quinone oxidoreductase subunit H [Deltaproteobacteria bacterium PRO3]|nr:NADH-quinone oxidoreductase subunit H [Deltaproteobacteria bacterium PRO3]